jgi:transcriptional regulator
MYIPEAFGQHDQAVLFDFIEQHGFGLLVTRGESEPFATHLPLLLDRAGGGHGALLGHTAAANPQIVQAAGQSVLAIFSGPHAYISPSWYEADKLVPTWNYAAVHVYGTLHIVRDEETLANILRSTVALYESSRPEPWTFDAGGDFARKLMKQVIGFHIVIDRIEGKWKLSQNQPAERQAKVVRALRAAPDENSQAVAALMEKLAER